MGVHRIVQSNANAFPESCDIATVSTVWEMLILKQKLVTKQVIVQDSIQISTCKMKTFPLGPISLSSYKHKLLLSQFAAQQKWAG